MVDSPPAQAAQICSSFCRPHSSEGNAFGHDSRPTCTGIPLTRICKQSAGYHGFSRCEFQQGSHPTLGLLDMGNFTCVGVRVLTNSRDIPRQFERPSFFSPARNARCSSIVHAIPRQGPKRSVQLKRATRKKQMIIDAQREALARAGQSCRVLK